MPEIRAKRAASNVLNVDAGYKLLEVAFVADNLMAEQLRGGNISNHLLLMGNIVSWILSFCWIEGMRAREAYKLGFFCDCWSRYESAEIWHADSSYVKNKMPL